MPKLLLMARGNLGNQMLQYIYAESLRDRIGKLEVIGYDMPVWGLSRVAQPRLAALAPSLRLSRTDGEGVDDLFASGRLWRAKLRDVPLRCELFSTPSRFETVFPLHPDVAPLTTGDELLINVRGDEILRSVHRGYGPIPLYWYRQLIAETGLNPVFMGQLGDDYYSDLLRRSFPKARFVPSMGIAQDFTAIRLAAHVALGVSTFSWLAGWLGRAETVHMPLLGIFNPRQRPDIWMIPEDPRWCFYCFPPREWTASDTQRAELEAPGHAPRLSSDEIVALRHENEMARASVRSLAKQALSRRAPLSYIPVF